MLFQLHYWILVAFAVTVFRICQGLIPSMIASRLPMLPHSLCVSFVVWCQLPFTRGATVLYTLLVPEVTLPDFVQAVRVWTYHGVGKS